MIFESASQFHISLLCLGPVYNSVFMVYYVLNVKALIGRRLQSEDGGVAAVLLVTVPLCEDLQPLSPAFYSTNLIISSALFAAIRNFNSN